MVQKTTTHMYVQNENANDVRMPSHFHLCFFDSPPPFLDFPGTWQKFRGIGPHKIALKANELEIKDNLLLNWNFLSFCGFGIWSFVSVVANQRKPLEKIS